MPKVSVIVASYNYGKYIKLALDSLLNQTYKDFEVVIVDDGSTDNSVDIIKQYTERYHNFNLYQHANCSNRGLAETLKLGISKSSGEYICFLESDDYWDKDYLQEKIQYASKQKKIKLISNDLVVFGSEQSKRKGPLETYAANVREYFYNNKSKNNFNGLEYSNEILPTFSAIMIKRDIIETLNFDSAIPAWLDWWLWRQYAIKYPIGWVNKKLTYWRAHADSYASEAGEAYEDNRRLFLEKSNNFLQNKYPTEYKKYYQGSLLEHIFSVKFSNNKRHKIITIFGIKISVKQNIESRSKVKENKKISVVIPVYNVEPNFIETAINSVLNQTYKNIEIIVVNDGSTDENTLNYLKTINNPQIKIINQENKGLGGARNTGIENSTGEYIGFLDSDDWLDSNFYETLYKLCEKNNADIACGVLTRTELDFEYPMDNFDNCVISNFAKKMKYITNGSTCSKLFRKDLFSDIKFPEHTYYEDNPVLIRLFIKSKNAAFTYSVKYYYRVNDKSITLDETHKQKIKKDCLTILKDVCSILKNKSQKEKDIVLVRFVPHLVKMDFYNEDLDYQKQVNKVLGRKYKKYLKLPRNTFIQNIFSVKNSSDKKHKVITIFGIKIKIKRKPRIYDI